MDAGGYDKIEAGGYDKIEALTLLRVHLSILGG
jgi:hypothetical protein